MPGNFWPLAGRWWPCVPTGRANARPCSPWHDLPAGSFASEGTGVNVALLEFKL